MYIEDDFYFMQKMKSITRYKEKWEAIRSIYKEKLDAGSIASKIKFTAHDYSHHCVNIYTNIENLVLKRFCGNLSPTELFILNVAVILHDYMMAVDTSKRSTHAQDASEYVMKTVNSNIGTELNSLLTNDEARMISYVILGHGNVKEDGLETNTLKYVADIYLNDYFNCPIKIPYLAAILRLADEFDCTANRLTRPLCEVGFTDSDEDMESAKHYRKLQLIERIGIKERPSNILYLYCNDFVLDTMQYEEDAKNVIEIREKLLKELNNVKQHIYFNFEQEICPIKIYDDVEIVSQNKEFVEIISKIK